MMFAVQNRWPNSMRVKFMFVALSAWILGAFACLAAYATHVIWAIQVFAERKVPANDLILAVAGFFPPIGIVNGAVIWFT